MDDILLIWKYLLPRKSEQINMNTSSNKVIVVLGMHRSGTSAITRSLQVLGVGLGDNLYPPGFDNPKGFWEDRDCIAINEELLNHLGSAYNRLGLAWNLSVETPAISPLFLKAIRLVSDSVSKNHGVWGVKDPRMCRLLGFWKLVFQACDCDVSFVISLRNPVSVAESLENRDQLPMEKGYFLWLQHVVPSIIGTQETARLVVDYDLMVESPEEQMIRLARHLKMPIDTKNNALFKNFSEDFLDGKLRHSTYSLSQIYLDARLPRDVLKAYSLLLRVARDEISIDSNEVQSGFEEINSNLQAYSAAFAYINALEEKHKDFVIERNGQIEHLNQAVIERDEKIEHLNQAVIERDGRIEHLNQAVIERDGKIEHLNQAVIKRDGKIEHLNQTLTGKEQTVQALTAQLAGKEQAVQALAIQLTVREQTAQALSLQMAEKEQAAQALATQLTVREQTAQALALQMTEKEQAAQTLASQMAEKERALAEIRGSKAWEIALLFRRIRVALAPPNSRRARMLRQIINVVLSPFKKIGRDQTLEKDLALIQTSGLFDKVWYLANNPDVAQTKVDPVRHYLLFGGFEGRDPNLNFDSDWYLNAYEDVKKAGMNPLVHYLRYGKAEKRDINADSALIRASGMFDEAWYLEHYPDVTQAGIDPVIHYLLLGGFEARDPNPQFSSALYLDAHDDVKKDKNNPLVHFLRQGKQEERISDEDNFDAQLYLYLYPDIKKSGIDPYQHYQQFGKFEGRLGSFPKTIFLEGYARFEPSRDTVLIVSHEASRTGAPILSLNVAQRLQKKYNVVSLLPGGGPLVEDFLNASVFVAGPLSLRYDVGFIDRVIEQLTKSYNFKFAIVNSIVSRAALPALAKRFIPTIHLIHEFAAYTRPKEAFLEAALWSHEIVFSAPITHENAISVHPELSDHSFHIIPQGLCDIPSLENDTDSKTKEDIRLLNTLRPEGLPSETVIILGVGSVQVRKGVDLFIECAARVAQFHPGKQFRFVWIGNDYDPDNDMGYSIYLAEHIRRSGLEDLVFIMKDTPNIETAYKAADILLISSRLDPLPNVAIDAMMHKLPVLCFDKATGIADILIANGLEKECVAPYLDTSEIAARVLAFIESKSLRQKIGERLHQLALEKFNMEKYVNQLENIGLSLDNSISQEKKDIEEIERSGIAWLDYYLPPHIKPEEAIQYYVRTWASGIGRRKLFPGFHPGIFLEQYTINKPGEDPLANYIRAGQPDGPWKHEVITAEEIARPLPSKTRIALHLHVCYTDLFPEILAQLSGNRVCPDLFISVPTEIVRDDISHELRNYAGNVVEIKVVPNNRGHDIGPFLSAFGKAFVRHYDIVGHLHTKRAVEIQDNTMEKNWRSFPLENLLGGKNKMADIILGRMAKDHSIGMVFPDDPNVVGWERNQAYPESLGRKLGLKQLPKYFIFPSDTMFWARVKALLPIFNLDLTWDDYPEESLPNYGTMAQALEKLFPFVVSKAGFRNVLTNVKGVTR